MKLRTMAILVLWSPFLLFGFLNLLLLVGEIVEVVVRLLVAAFRHLVRRLRPAPSAPEAAPVAVEACPPPAPPLRTSRRPAWEGEPGKNPDGTAFTEDDDMLPVTENRYGGDGEYPIDEAFAAELAAAFEGEDGEEEDEA